MISMAVDGPVTMPQETGPEQLPAGSLPALAELPAPVQRDQIRPLEVAECSLCGIALPLGLLVPDGGQACADIRWYCKDAKSCTERWTTARPLRHTPAERPDGTPEAARPAAALTSVPD
jgi:hypothetical protein